MYRTWADSPSVPAVILRSPSSTAIASPIGRTDVTAISSLAWGKRPKNRWNSAVISGRPVNTLPCSSTSSPVSRNMPPRAAASAVLNAFTVAAASVSIVGTSGDTGSAARAANPPTQQAANRNQRAKNARGRPETIVCIPTRVLKGKGAVRSHRQEMPTMWCIPPRQWALSNVDQADSTRRRIGSGFRGTGPVRTFGSRRSRAAVGWRSRRRCRAVGAGRTGRRRSPSGSPGASGSCRSAPSLRRR